MGKFQSKPVYRKREGPEGECFVVNAHFNPACEEDIEWEKSTTSVSRNLSVSSCPEISFCIKNPLSNNRGSVGDQQSLQVILPPEEGSNASMKVLTMDQETQEGKSTPNKKAEDMTQHLKVEEFECGVSLESFDKQEWSFTLYDFGGHGKVTKDDITGLVRSIYDAIGNSVKLPPSGSKTIKVRLTMSPGGTPQNNVCNESKDCRTENSTSPGDKNHCHKSQDQKNAPQESVGANHHHHSKDYISPRCKRKHKSNELYKQELVELVQKNMERNLLKQHQMRQLVGDYRSDDNRKHKNLAHRNENESSVESRERRDYYLDLVGVENNCSSHVCKNNNSPNGLRSPKSKSNGLKACSHSRHNRSRSHDLSNRIPECINEYELGNGLQKESNEGRSRSYDANDGVHSTKRTTSSKPHKHRPFSLPVQDDHPSPHHRKHKNRERDHERAMQQVANWIDQELMFQNPSKVVIQRHEHHHHHTHHHHHHYHYCIDD